MDTVAVVDTSASVVGVVLTIWTLLRARGAEKAAKEAREAVRQGNAAEEFRTLAAIASDLLRCSQASQTEAAQLRSRDVLSEMGKARTHWEGLLDKDAFQRTGKIQRVTAKISHALSLRQIGEMSQEEKEELMRACHDLVVKLSEEAGRMLKVAERRKD